MPIVPRRTDIAERERQAVRSVSGNDYDCDDNECRDQRKSAIKYFRFSQTPGKDANNPKEPHKQTSNTDT